jgi:hypothetical protein
MTDIECDYTGPMYNTLGSVPDLTEAKRSLWRLLFQRYETRAAEIESIIAELQADRLDVRRCEATVPGIIERLRGGDYFIPLGVEPPLIVNWLCCHVRPGVCSEERRQLALWLQEALREARQREGVTR